MSSKRKSHSNKTNATPKKSRIKGQCDISVNKAFQDESVLKKLRKLVQDDQENGDGCK